MSWKDFVLWAKIFIEYEADGSISALKSQLIEGEKNMDNTDKQSKPLEEKDLTVRSKEEQITLDAHYSDLKVNEDSLNQEGTLLTSEMIGDYYYKYYMHEYTDFKIVTSNLNYNVKGEDFNTYYMVQIDLKTPVFETMRGIKIGSSKEQVVNAYGEGQETETPSEWGYTFKNKAIYILFNSIDKVEHIRLVVDKLPQV